MGYEKSWNWKRDNIFADMSTLLALDEKFNTTMFRTCNMYALVPHIRSVIESSMSLSRALELPNIPVVLCAPAAGIYARSPCARASSALNVHSHRNIFDTSIMRSARSCSFNPKELKTLLVHLLFWTCNGDRRGVEVDISFLFLLSLQFFFQHSLAMQRRRVKNSHWQHFNFNREQQHEKQQKENCVQK